MCLNGAVHVKHMFSGHKCNFVTRSFVREQFALSSFGCMVWLHPWPTVVAASFQDVPLVIWGCLKLAPLWKWGGGAPAGADSREVCLSIALLCWWEMPAAANCTQVDRSKDVHYFFLFTNTFDLLFCCTICLYSHSIPYRSIFSKHITSCIFLLFCTILSLSVFDYIRLITFAVKVAFVLVSRNDQVSSIAAWKEPFFWFVYLCPLKCRHVQTPSPPPMASVHP